MALNTEKDNEILDDEQDEENLAAEIQDSVRQDQAKEKGAFEAPKDVFIMPLTRRPFFPEWQRRSSSSRARITKCSKLIAKSEHKCMGLFLTHQEDVNIYKVGFDDLYQVGVLARILRIIPMEQGGAQVVLNMEKRISIKKPLKSAKHLKAQIEYHDDQFGKLSKELKAYSISIITTIKELLKLNPLFKEELQIFLRAFRFYRTGQVGRFCCRSHNC